jgi:hypothetical protein
MNDLTHAVLAPLGELHFDAAAPVARRRPVSAETAASAPADRARISRWDALGACLVALATIAFLVFVSGGAAHG